MRGGEGGGVQQSDIPRAPSSWSPPGPCEGWSYQTKHNAPAEEAVDNPGSWSLYLFQVKYRDGKYIGHFTLAGAKFLPNNPEDTTTMVRSPMALTKPPIFEEMRHGII